MSVADANPSLTDEMQKLCLEIAPDFEHSQYGAFRFSMSSEKISGWMTWKRPLEETPLRIAKMAPNLEFLLTRHVLQDCDGEKSASRNIWKRESQKMVSAVSRNTIDR